MAGGDPGYFFISYIRRTLMNGAQNKEVSAVANTAEKASSGTRIKFVHLLFALTGLMIFSDQHHVSDFIYYLLGSQ